jgi:hypothetical protein
MTDEAIRGLLHRYFPEAHVLFVRDKDGMRHVITFTGDLDKTMAAYQANGFEIEPTGLEKAS